MYRLTIYHDEFAENPNDEDTLFHLHSFSNRHVDFTDPDVLLACQYEFPEGHEDEGFACDEMPTAHAEGRIEDHEWVGPKGFLLSYFEHGLCKWGLSGTMTGMPDFRWDGVQYAGYLEVLDDNDWYNQETPERQEELAAQFCENYTDWANGNCYGYVLEEVSVAECDLGFDHETVRHVDGSGGIIGDKWLEQELQETLSYFEIGKEDLEVKDEAFGMADYLILYPREKVA